MEVLNLSYKVNHISHLEIPIDLFQVLHIKFKKSEGEMNNTLFDKC